MLHQLLIFIVIKTGCLKYCSLYSHLFAICETQCILQNMKSLLHFKQFKLKHSDKWLCNGLGRKAEICLLFHCMPHRILKFITLISHTAYICKQIISQIHSLRLNAFLVISISYEVFSGVKFWDSDQLVLCLINTDLQEWKTDFGHLLRQSVVKVKQSVTSAYIINMNIP